MDFAHHNTSNHLLQLAVRKGSSVLVDHHSLRLYTIFKMHIAFLSVPVS